MEQEQQCLSVSDDEVAQQVLGPPGVGKAHLAVSLRLTAIRAGSGCCSPRLLT